MATEFDSINELTPEERITVRYPEYAKLFDILVHEFGFRRNNLMTVLGCDEKCFDDIHVSFNLSDLLKLVKSAKEYCND